MKKIVVIGATGMLGKPVAKELIKADFEITLAVRDVLKAREIFPFAKMIAADVFDKESLRKVFLGQAIVYISLNIPRNGKPSDRLPEKDGIANIIEVAKEAGIQRIALLSSLVMRYNGMNGYRWWLFSMKQLAVEQVKKSGIPYSIFYASSFMETLGQTMLKGNKLLLAGKSKVPMWFIAGEDYGRQVASSFQKLTIENREYIVQGLEAFTWDKAARVFADNYKLKKIKILTAPIKMLEFLGNFNRVSKYGYKIMQALNNYPEEFEAEETWKELGKPTVRLEEYVKGLTNKLIEGKD